MKAPGKWTVEGKLDTSSKAYPLLTMLIGLIAFLISGVIASVFTMFTNSYFLGSMIAGGIGGLLLGLFLQRQKLSRMIIASIIVMPIGLVISFSLVEGFGALFPSIGASFEKSSTPDIIVIVLLSIVFGAVFGALIYGRKSIWLFSFVCGIVAVPFGLLVGAMNSGHPIKFWLENLLGFLGKIDLNFLTIVISLGTGIGLSIGMNTYRKRGL